MQYWPQVFQLTPKFLLVDNGKTFQSHKFHLWCRRRRCQLLFIPLYSHKNIVLIEHFNQLLINKLQKMGNDGGHDPQKNWGYNMQSIVRLLQESSLGPNISPRGLAFQIDNRGIRVDVHVWIRMVNKALEYWQKERHILRGCHGHPEEKLKPGDLVMIYAKLGKKLAPRLFGSVLVVSVLYSVRYLVKIRP